jgi:hypothetical protein
MHAILYTIAIIAHANKTRIAKVKTASQGHDIVYTSKGVVAIPVILELIRKPGDEGVPPVISVPV